MPTPPTGIAPGASPAEWKALDADRALRRLLDATLAHEKEVAARDTEIARIQQRHAAKIDSAADEIATLNVEIEQFFRARRGNLTSLKLPYGTLGINTGTNPALVPLNEKWTWKKIAAKLRRTFKAEYFLAPAPPGIDKVKAKKKLSAEQLTNCGMKLQHSETFYIELHRLPEAA